MHRSMPTNPATLLAAGLLPEQKAYQRYCADLGRMFPGGTLPTFEEFEQATAEDAHG